MSVRYLFSDENDSPLSQVKQAGCWVLLKDLQSNIRNSRAGFEDWKKLPSDYQNHWRYSSYRDGSANVCGIPITKDSNPVYLRVYHPYRAERRQERGFRTLSDIYEEVLQHLPQWFDDFELIKRKGEEEEYLRVPLGTSSCKNYNALRWIRSLTIRGQRSYDYSKGLPPVAQILLDEAGYVNEDGYYMVLHGIGDGHVLPHTLVSDVKKLVEMIKRGPILENDDLPLGEMDPSIYTKYGLFYMNRAFLKAEEGLSQLHGLEDGDFDTMVGGLPLTPSYRQCRKFVEKVIKEAA